MTVSIGKRMPDGGVLLSKEQALWIQSVIQSIVRVEAEFPVEISPEAHYQKLIADESIRAAETALKDKFSTTFEHVSRRNEGGQRYEHRIAGEYLVRPMPMAPTDATISEPYSVSDPAVYAGIILPMYAGRAFE